MNNYYPGDNANGYQYSLGNNNINNSRSLLLNSGMNIARNNNNNSGIDLSNPNGYQSYQPIDLSKGGYGYQSQNIDMAKGRFSNPTNSNIYGNDNANGRANYAAHSNKQADFDSRQRAFNENIIARSNEMKAKEENARNIDRLNRINAEMTKKKYVDQMDLVKQAQFGLAGSKNSNSVYDQLQQQGGNNRNGNTMRIQDQGMNDGSDNRRTSNQLPKRQETPEFKRPSRQIQSQGALQQQQYTQPFSFGARQPGGPGELYPSVGKGGGPYSGYFGGAQNNPTAPFSFGMPQYQQYPGQLPPMFYPPAPSFPLPYRAVSRSETKTSKPLKEIAKVIEKQNEVMSSLMQKLNEPEDRTRDSNTNQMDDVARYMQMFNQINDLKMQQQQMQQQQQYAQPAPNNSNNQVVQLMFQQQMMQALMYNQMMQNQKAQQEQNARPQKMTALEMIKKMEREEALENTIKQLILAKGGNLEELQAKLDMLMGVKRQGLDKPATPKDDDDSDDTDSNDDDDDGPELDEAALLAAKKKEMAAKARKRVKAVAWMNVFAFIMLNNQKLREDERRQEVLQSIKVMQQICMKTGLLWAIGACDKSFAVMRAKPKDNYDIINDVDKLKTNMLEDRVNQICNLTTLLLDGIFESLQTLPADIAKYSAIFYQEKSYLPQGCVSQFEIDRLEFSTAFGYVLNMTQERKTMLTGLHFFNEIIILVILAKPWDYQMNETRLKDDDLTKQKLRIVASLLYHILFEHFKKTVNPVQNNILGIPEIKKPQHKQEPHLYELGVKNNADKGTRYNIVTGLIDFNSLLVVWTTKGDWKNEILQKMLKIVSFITEKATKISDDANELERLDYIKAAQEDQLLLPVSVRKTKFDTTFQK